jgi:hypothetical protein
MRNFVEEHLELEKIFWSACMERDPNEWVELSVLLCGVLDQRRQRETGDGGGCSAGYIAPEASEQRLGS